MLSASPTNAPPVPLTRVQQVDPACTQLLEQSGPCDLYRCGPAGWAKCQSQHQRTGQGRLVLYNRSASPKHAFAVIGCGTADRVQPLVAGGAWPHAEPPFLLFSDGAGSDGDRHGVWFRNEADCHRLADRLARLALGDCSDQPAAGGERSASSGAVATAEDRADAGGSGSIVEMLGRAQAEYETAAAAARGAETCELVARRIRQQLGLAQPEEKAAAAAASVGNHIDSEDLQQHVNQPPPQSPALATEEEFLLTPGMLESPPLPLQLLQQPPPPPSPPQRSQPDGEDTKSAPAVIEEANAALPTAARQHLCDSLASLLEQDEDFLSSVHRAYIASLQKRLRAA